MNDEYAKLLIKETFKTNKLLELLIELVIDTHNYVDLEKHKTRLYREITND